MAVESGAKRLQYQVRCPELPLALYREVAAHLRQTRGVQVELLPQMSAGFSYQQSPVGGLRLRYPADQAERCQREIETVLSYYGRRYRPWEVLRS